MARNVAVLPTHVAKHTNTHSHAQADVSCIPPAKPLVIAPKKLNPRRMSSSHTDYTKARKIEPQYIFHIFMHTPLLPLHVFGAPRGRILGREKKKFTKTGMNANSSESEFAPLFTTLYFVPNYKCLSHFPKPYFFFPPDDTHFETQTSAPQARDNLGRKEKAERRRRLTGTSRPPRSSSALV
jgi:hypothetical protein